MPSHLLCSPVLFPIPQRDGTKTTVSLADIVVTDVRPEAKGNPFRVLLAPSASSPKSVAAQGTRPQAWAGGSTNDTFSFRQAGGGSTSGVASGGEGGPLVAVTATTSGDGAPLEAEVHLASFACNIMVDAIRDSLLALVEVNVALLKMLGAIDSGADRAPERSGIGGDPLGMLGSLDGVEEPRSEVRHADEAWPIVCASCRARNEAQARKPWACLYPLPFAPSYTALLNSSVSRLFAECYLL